MSANEKIMKAGIVREEGWLYFVDKKGNVARSKMMKGFGSHSRGSTEIIAKTELKRESGWLYYIDKEGDISRVKMVIAEKTEPEKKSSASVKQKKKVSKKTVTRKKVTDKKKKVASTRYGRTGVSAKRAPKKKK